MEEKLYATMAIPSTHTHTYIYIYVHDITSFGNLSKSVWQENKFMACMRQLKQEREKERKKRGRISNIKKNFDTNVQDYKKFINSKYRVRHLTFFSTSAYLVNGNT